MSLSGLATCGQPALGSEAQSDPAPSPCSPRARSRSRARRAWGRFVLCLRRGPVVGAINSRPPAGHDRNRSQGRRTHRRCGHSLSPRHRRFGPPDARCRRRDPAWPRPCPWRRPPTAGTGQVARDNQGETASSLAGGFVRRFAPSLGAPSHITLLATDMEQPLFRGRRCAIDAERLMTRSPSSGSGLIASTPEPRRDGLDALSRPTHRTVASPV